MKGIHQKLRIFLKSRVQTLSGEAEESRPVIPNDMKEVYRLIRKGDVVLVEGRGRLSRIIKLFTQSQWSHAAIYIGDELLKQDPERRKEIVQKYGDNADKLLIEALIEDGVVASPLEKYRNHQLRISRPVGINDAKLKRVLKSSLNDLGKQYDRRNILSMALQLFPFSFGPFEKGNAEICIGACSEFQVICSGFIAKAFQSVGFFIRPVFHLLGTAGKRSADRPVAIMRHPSRITPRDFDLSSNFEIIK